jgi:hypothetical protein
VNCNEETEVADTAKPHTNTGQWQYCPLGGSQEDQERRQSEQLPAPPSQLGRMLRDSHYALK